MALRRRLVPLGQLLGEPDPGAGILVSGVQLDSRLINRGDLFLALKGQVADGRLFVQESLARGAAAVLLDVDGPDVPNEDPRIIPIQGLRSRCGEIASRFFEHPSRKLLMIGVTGTNGKTSCCHFIAQALRALGTNCGVMGTLGYGLAEPLMPLERTTPDPVTFQRCLAELEQAGARAVSFEASSHGLDQGRLNGSKVDIALFTNLSRDHLDYHPDTEAYYQSKRRLFELPGISACVVNVDDPHGRRLSREVEGRARIVAYGIENPGAEVSCSDCRFEPGGISCRIDTPWGKGELSIPLLGEFNLANATAVVAVLGALGHSLDACLSAVSGLKNVKGRMDLLHHPSGADVVVDYAHTPDALAKVLKSLRRHCRGELWCVFGCGGDRDKGKRAMMGEVASALADVAVVTSDNPRTEPADAIAADILMGMDRSKPLILELDRRQAIRRALEGVESGDLLLVAGKGHEEYQEINGVRLPYSDYAEVLGAAA